MTSPQPPDPRRFEGFLEHVEQHAGPFTGGEGPELEGGGNRGYGLMAFEFPGELPLATVVSTGLRFQPVRAILETELACTVLADQFGAAHHLVDYTCGLVMRRGEVPEWGTVLTNATPVLADTRIHGVVATTHPYFDEEFNALRDARGEIQLRIVTLVPATPEELAFAEQEGDEAMLRRWAEAGTPLEDVTRASAV